MTPHNFATGRSGTKDRSVPSTVELRIALHLGFVKKLAMSGCSRSSIRADVYSPWLEVAKQCNYLGVQTYSRAIVGKRDLPPPADAERTQIGWEFYPECVEHVVRYLSKEVKVPLIVTENGIATTDDTRRVEYFRRALTGLKRAIDDGVDVRGYVAWTFMDNFEWMSGFTPKFGIVSVDRMTQRRTVKPSGVMLGNIARNNSLG